MKRLLSMILAAVLCFGVAVLPAAAEDATVPEPVTQTQEKTAEAEPVTQTQEEPAEPEPTAQTPEEPTEPVSQSEEEAAEPDPSVPVSHQPLSPYQRPDWNDYENEADYREDQETWLHSVYGRYHYWRVNAVARGNFDPAYRAFYADDPELTISDHFVYRKQQSTEYENKKRVKRTYAVVIDYFDTDEAEQACTTLHIPAELDGYRVILGMFSNSGDADGQSGIGYANNSVKKLVLEDGGARVDAYAFSGFTALKKVYLPASVTAVGSGAFRNCISLKKVVVRGRLERIGSVAFENCRSLRSFDALKTVKFIDDRAFANCGLRSVTLYGLVWMTYGEQDVASHTFANCKELETVSFTEADPDDKLNYGLDITWSCFSGCTALQTVDLPTDCKRISIFENAFEGCTALRAVQHVTCLKTVYNNAFLNCTALDTFVLPKGIEFAEDNAFKGCTALNRFFINSKNPNLLKYKNYDDGDMRGRIITGNFLASLPKDCTIFVVNKEMKYVFKTTGFKGAVKIRVNVPTPKTARMTRQNGKVRFVWSTVTKADGYRIWSYDAKTGKYTRLATVKAPKTTVTLKSNAKQFVIRAYRIETGDISWSAKKAFR